MNIKAQSAGQKSQNKKAKLGVERKGRGKQRSVCNSESKAILILKSLGAGDSVYAVIAWAEVRINLEGVYSFLLPCGSRASNSGCET